MVGTNVGWYERWLVRTLVGTNVGGYEITLVLSRHLMPSCDSPLVPLLCAVTILSILQSQLSFMDRVYDGTTIFDASASNKR